MTERESTEAELLDTFPRKWDGGYELRCVDCEWTGGVYLLGPVALKKALGHTIDTHHHVKVFQGVG